MFQANHLIGFGAGGDQCGGVGADILNASDGFTYSIDTAVFSGAIANTHDDTGSTQCRWTGDLGATYHYLEVDFTTARTLTEVTLTTGANDTGTRIYLEYWNGSSWVDDTLNLYSGAGWANSTQYTKTLYPNNVTATKIRFSMTTATTSYPSVDEVEAKVCV